LEKRRAPVKAAALNPLFFSTSGNIRLPFAHNLTIMEKTNRWRFAPAAKAAPDRARRLTGKDGTVYFYGAADAANF
jgi:hypothetical protein